jgi:hypothetical protein
MPYIIGPDSALQRKHAWNWSVADWGKVCSAAPLHSDCIKVTQKPYILALNEYATLKNCTIKPDVRPFNLNFETAKGGANMARAILIRDEHLVDIEDLNQPIQADDIILIEGLIC